MLINRHRLRILGIYISAAVLLLAVVYILLLKAVDINSYRETILSELSKSLNRSVTYRTGKLTFNLGPAFLFENVLVKEPDGHETFLQIDRLTCNIDFLPLLKKQIVIHGFVAEKPVIRLERFKDGSFNISDLLKGEGKESPLKINDIKVKDGDITIIDRLLQQSPVTTMLVKTDLTLDNLGRARRTGIKLSTRLSGDAGGSLALNGSLRLAPKGVSLDQSTVDASISAKHLDLGQFWPYYRQHVPFRKIIGVLDTDCEFAGKLSEFTTTGRVSLRSLHFDYQPVFKRPITSKSINVKYNLEMSRTDIDVKAVEIDIDGAGIEGSCAIRNYRSADPRITAQAVTTKFDYDKYSQFIPYGIIVKDTSEWIEQHIAGGIYQLDKGRLDGLVSQILHMEKGENYNILYIKGRVEKGVVSYGREVPTFNNIKGVLEMKGKDFFLHNMSGRFGESPMSLEGTITDYPLDKPSGYPFRMTISPGRNEVAWLLGKDISKSLTYDGNSYMSLAGDGYTSGYNLSGDWDLTPAAYSYANYVKKPVGTSSTVKFKGSINQKEASLTRLHYTLGAMALDISAKYPFATSKTLDLVVNSNPFSAENLTAFSPILNQYQPSGKMQLALKGSSPDTDQRVFDWNGNLSLSGASFRYSSEEKPVSAISGTISFRGKGMESSQLTAKIGSTVFSGRGTINSLDPLVFDSTFFTPRVDLADFGLAKETQSPKITQVRGDVSYRDNRLLIKSLSGQLNTSQLTARGTVTDLASPKAELSITSSYLDISDLVLLSAVEKRVTSSPRGSSPPVLNASVKAERGTFVGADYERLVAAITLDSDRLQVKTLGADTLEGKITTRGRIDFLTPAPTYLFDFRLSEAAASEVLHLFTIEKRELTGDVNIDGELSARGETFDAMKRSLAGKIRVHAVKGTLRQFPVLSKIFSILNVYQLFKLKLPDMVSEGMPYNNIKGTLVFKAGTMSTNDLFMASHAMNISMVGKYDYVNDNYDLTVGLQPLQTVDKVVSRIPVVGWILTGKDKSLITTYFEIKGKSNNPKVSAIPVKALGKGVLEIFKRVFQLPEKLVTDTGEVILGN